MSAAYAKSTAPDEMFSPAHEQMEAMVTELQSAKMLSASHGEVEAYVRERGRELERRLYQAHLDLRAARERPVPVRGSDGVNPLFVEGGGRVTAPPGREPGAALALGTPDTIPSCERRDGRPG